MSIIITIENHHLTVSIDGDITIDNVFNSLEELLSEITKAICNCWKK